MDAFAFDSDEILEVTFDLLYDEDGDSDTTDLSLLSAFDFNGKAYDGFKIFDPDSIVEAEISIDPVTQDALANGQIVSFSPEANTINKKIWVRLLLGWEMIINGRATGVTVSSASASSITLSDDPTQGSGLNEGDQIIFASRWKTLLIKHSQVIGQYMILGQKLLNIDVTVTSIAEEDLNQHLLTSCFLLMQYLESTDGSWAFSDMQTAYQAFQTNDFYTDLEQVLSTQSKVFDENDNHIATLRLICSLVK